MPKSAREMAFSAMVYRSLGSPYFPPLGSASRSTAARYISARHGGVSNVSTLTASSPDKSVRRELVSNHFAIGRAGTQHGRWECRLVGRIGETLRLKCKPGGLTIGAVPSSN